MGWRAGGLAATSSSIITTTATPAAATISISSQPAEVSGLLSSKPRLVGNWLLVAIPHFQPLVMLQFGPSTAQLLLPQIQITPGSDAHSSALIMVFEKKEQKKREHADEGEADKQADGGDAAIVFETEEVLHIGMTCGA